MDASTHLIMLNEREKKRNIFRHIRYIEGKLKGISTLCVTQTANDSTVIEIMQQVPLESAIITENLKEYHRTELVCPLLQEPLLSSIDQFGTGFAVKSVLDSIYIPPGTISEHAKTFLCLLKRPDDGPRGSIGRVKLAEFR